MLRHLLRISGERLRTGAGFAVASVTAALLAFWTIAHLARDQPRLVQLCITAVIIALSIVRTEERQAGPAAGRPVPPWAGWVARFAMIPLVALLGSALGPLVGDRPELGFALIGVPLVLAIWVRRFGPVWTRLGTLWSFPFIAALVTPTAAVGGGSGVWWGALAAFVAVGWGSILGWLVRGAPLGRGAERVDVAPVDAVFVHAGWTSAPAAAPADVQPASAKPGSEAPTGAAAARRFTVGDRMAIHLAVALAAAILLGWWLLPAHLGWLVLTAYLVTSGNRGRADVVYKGIQRLVGAGLGTIAATLLGALFAPGDSGALAVMFAILGVGAVLRTMSYAWWAAAMTGALALLYGYLGQGGTEFLGERLLAILLGGAVAIAASCFVLPVRSVDVLRRRLADLLGVGREVLTVDRAAPGRARLPGRVREAAGRVEQLAPPHHALRIVTVGRVPAARRSADLIDRATELGTGLEGFLAAPSRELGGTLGAELRSLREALLALRRE